MIIRVRIKDPDAFCDAIAKAVAEEVAAMPDLFDEEEQAERIGLRTNKAHKAVEKFVDYGEYVTICFDTEAETATVEPA